MFAYYYSVFIFNLSVKVNKNMKSNAKDDKNELQNINEFGESSEDTTSGFFESSSTLNNEVSYKSSTPEQFVAANANGRLRSRKMQQDVSYIPSNAILMICLL